MDKFRDGQRVTVTSKEHKLVGRSGTVSRLRRGDDGAWVNMDDDLPADVKSFPSADPRARNVVLYPDECEPRNPVSDV